jgi:hypothetical protein
LGYREDQNGYKNVSFKLRDGQQLAERNVAAATVEGWAAVCRHVKVMKEECMSREHEMDSVVERIMVNADVVVVDDDGETSECSVSCDDNDDIQVVVPIASYSE